MTRPGTNSQAKNAAIGCAVQQSFSARHYRDER
ncbi:hypothetical protein NK6_4073 [Bradyrhizobium diazoefficiens]|uniref:Uncharacterized protein n=1 Tax=Bradyrhizobium diazoefficiens TaxID=1355477 RepID=A0A0E4FXZ8_9BRAD|nr:hypothetical protein NK6_4073 [Bradyrhizobium diazoefficiens]